MYFALILWWSVKESDLCIVSGSLGIITVLCFYWVWYLIYRIFEAYSMWTKDFLLIWYQLITDQIKEGVTLKSNQVPSSSLKCNNFTPRLKLDHVQLCKIQIYSLWVDRCNLSFGEKCNTLWTSRLKKYSIHWVLEALCICLHHCHHQMIGFQNIYGLYAL